MTVLNMELGENSYKINVGQGLLDKADKHFNLDRKVLIVTDDGVPQEYAKKIAYFPFQVNKTGPFLSGQSLWIMVK